jgi:hypothetical protein
VSDEDGVHPFEDWHSGENTTPESVTENVSGKDPVPFPKAKPGMAAYTVLIAVCICVDVKDVTVGLVVDSESFSAFCAIAIAAAAICWRIKYRRPISKTPASIVTITGATMANSNALTALWQHKTVFNTPNPSSVHR